MIQKIEQQFNNNGYNNGTTKVQQMAFLPVFYWFLKIPEISETLVNTDIMMHFNPIQNTQIRIHNPEVTGSTPVLATTYPSCNSGGYFFEVLLIYKE
jgi:hypothetical protein